MNYQRLGSELLRVMRGRRSQPALARRLGYRANVAQTPEALLGIRMTISVYPALFFLIVIICLIAYRINKTLNIQIQDELAERRKRFAPAP